MKHNSLSDLRNPDLVEQRFHETVDSLTLFGIERNFYDLSSGSGPEAPSWLDGATLYEIYVRAFSREGTFTAVRERLPELRDLGVSVLWLMPVYPIGREERKGRMGSPYAVRDYFTVNPEYGTEEDFKSLVQEAHRLGLKLLLDMVANHVAPDYQAHGTVDDILQRDDSGRPQRRIAEWSDVIDLDYSKEQTRRHMLQVMQHWIEKFDVDGFRCDVAGMVPLDFWEWAVPQLKKVKADIFLLAEWESPLLHKNTFHATYDWSLYELMKLVHTGKLPARRLAEWIELKNDTYPQNAVFLRFLENHDKARAAETFGAALLPFLVFIFTIDGLPLIYNGQEIGAKAYVNLFEKEEIDWQQRSTSVYKAFKKLISLRKEYKMLWSREYRFKFVPRVPDLLYMDRGKDRALYVLLNFGAREVDLTGLKLPVAGKVLFNTDRLWNGQTLRPFQALIMDNEIQRSL